MTVVSSLKTLARAARACVNEADRADKLGAHRYAAELRRSARTALGELNAISPRAPVDAETAKRQERARATAAVLLTGLH